MIWHWPQIVQASLLVLSVIVAICHHGEPRDPHNGPAMFIAVLVTAAILYFGGFWTGGVLP